MRISSPWRTGTIPPQARLAEATAQLQQDRDRRAAKEARIVEVAHEEGTANGIGEALDDLLTEFDLPGRPWRTTLRLNLEWTQNVSSQRLFSLTIFFLFDCDFQNALRHSHPRL